MLTKLERERILRREDLTVPERKNLNFRLRKKIVQLKQNLEDINLLLKFFPYEELREVIDSDYLTKSLEVTESLLQIVDPWAVGEHENGEPTAFRMFGNAAPICAPGKCIIDSVSRTATKEEICLHKLLKEHLDTIRFHVDPCTPDPVCRNPEYSRALMDKFVEIHRRATTQTPFTFSFSTYTDETGVSESGWVLREPTMIDISQLKCMRWKPRGLKSCTELPPLLKEKKLPIQWKKGPSISSSSTPEEIEEFNKWLTTNKGETHD